MRWCTRKSRRYRGGSWPRRAHRHRGISIKISGGDGNIEFFIGAHRVERLAIDHVGQRGDGVAFAGGHTVFVPYALGANGLKSNRWPIIPTAGICRASSGQRGADRAVVRIFWRLRGCAIQHWRPDPIAPGNAGSLIDTLRMPASNARSMSSSTPPARRRRITGPCAPRRRRRAAVGFAAATRSRESSAIDHCPILDPALQGALDAARVLAEVLNQRAAAGYSSHRR